MKKLNTLFNTFEQICNSNLQNILSRGYACTNLNPKSDIIICGINPSYRKEDSSGNLIFNFKDTLGDKYYDKFHKMFASYKVQYTIDYSDLIYIRHRPQSDIEDLFLNHNNGIKFIADQLKITQENIEKIKPKAIFLFNREAAKFLGKEINKEHNNNIWLGYELEKTNIDDAYKIVGLYDHPDRINYKLKNTNLIGTIIYFSRYIDWRTSKIIKSQIENDISDVFKQI